MYVTYIHIFIHVSTLICMIPHDFEPFFAIAAGSLSMGPKGDFPGP